jgi:acyl dehydratase
MTTLWLDDIEVGAVFTTDSYALSAEEIIEFARKYDPQPFHTDPAAATDTFFKGLAASGWHTAAITMRLIVTTGLPIATGIIGAGIDMTWPTATRPGDILHVELEISDVKHSRSDPSRAMVTTVHDTFNQDGEVRQHTTARILVFERPVGSDDT